MGDFWRPDRLFEGATVTLVAGGPSLDLKQVHSIALARLQGRTKVIAVNDAVYPCFFADIAYACDKRWWQHHNGVSEFRGIRVSLEETGFPDVRQLEQTGTEGYDPRPGTIRSGANSGYQALHLAAQLGAKRMVLVAYDMTGAPAQHWFGAHPGDIACIKHTHDNRIRNFAALKPVLDDLGIEVINASPGSALTFFRSLPLEQALET